MPTEPLPALPTAPPAPELLDQLGLAYVLLDRDAVIVAVNEVYAHLTEYTLPELLGQPYHELLTSPADRPLRQQSYLELLAQESIQGAYQRAIVTRSGQLRLMDWQAGLARDAAGQVSGVWLVGHEVTDRSQATQGLTDDRRYLQDFLDNAQDLVQHLNADNGFLFVNKAWKEKLGYTDDELSRLTLTDIVHPYYKAKLMYQLSNLYEGELVNRVETVFLTKTGKSIHLIGSLSVVGEPGHPLSSRAILHDITDRIKAERLQKIYYSIANLAISTKDLAGLYGAIHRELSKIIETSNLFIALCDDARTELQFVYHVDQYPTQHARTARPFSGGISEYIVEGGQPRYLTRPDLEELARTGRIIVFGTMPAVLLASPLSVGNRIIGVIAVQDYTKDDAFAPGDLDVLHFISNQVALAIERKRNEEQIGRQNARLTAIFESGSHSMWTVDVAGCLTTFNHNYAEAYLQRNGVPPEKGMRLVDTDLAHMAEATRRQFMQAYTTAIGGRTQRFEVSLHDLNGQELWAEVHLNPIYRPDGTVEEISAIGRDITEAKNAQLALQAEEIKFRDIFESFQDIYYRTNDEGLFTIVSPSVREVLGYNPAEVLGRPALDFYYDPAEREALVAEIAHHKRLRNFETRMRHVDGHPVSVLVNARLAPGSVRGTEGIARDVTEMRQMQDELRHAKDQAEAALEAKTQFLANMSHELRTPMNGIIGMIELLDQTVDTAEQRDYVDTLRKSSDALLTILNDILDLSKMQAGKLRLHATALELQAVLERIRSLFIYRAEQKRIRFTYHITPHTPRFVITDEIRLLQILSNLVANAIKFTNEGTVSVVVSSVSTDGEQHTLRFAVQDSGIGISAEDAKTLFNNFTQLDTTPSKAYGGTGLGLAISQQLAELLGGDIGVLSDVGQGSVFWFTISCREATAAEMPAPAAPRERVLRPFETAPRVLLVDDNPINQKVGLRLLAKLGCAVEVASDGPEAIARATGPGEGYDLIFMDIQMPDMDGVTATREIRQRLGSHCPPVVAMTAYSMHEDAGRFMRQGLDDYVGKPVKIHHLSEVLHRWLQLRRPATGEADAPVAADAVAAAEATPPESPPAPGPTSSHAEWPTLDLAVLRQLVEMGGEEFTADLYAEFEQEASQLLQEAALLVPAAPYDQLLKLLHQLKGTAATMGATAVANQARLLEQQLQEGPAGDTAVEFQLLQHYFALFVAEYPAAVAPATS